MFRKLLIRLTLLNAGVIAVLFCILIAGAYLYSRYDIHRRSEFFLNQVASDINAGRPTPMPFGPRPDPSHLPDSPQEPRPPLPPPPGLPFGNPVPPPGQERHGPVIFYAKLDTAGAIETTSTSLPFPSAQLEELVRFALSRPTTSGQLEWQEISYFYNIVARQDSSGQLVIFQNFEREREVFGTVMTAIIATGVFCLVASLFGSLFLARRAMRPIQRSWGQQRDFLADASHELRTPLAVIQASLDVIRSNPEERVSEQAPWLNNIGESVKSMASMVESLLFLARIDSGQHPIVKKPFILDQAIAASLAAYRPLADAKGVALSSVSDAEIRICGDEGRVRQVVGILIDNALRHTPAGGSIGVSLHRAGRSVLMAVTDNGEGIPPELQKKVFDRFFQADPARNKGATGLGLSIAKCIVEAHSGTIAVVSKPGHGASFLVRFPLGVPDRDCRTI